MLASNWRIARLHSYASVRPQKWSRDEMVISPEAQPPSTSACRAAHTPVIDGRGAPCRCLAVHCFHVFSAGAGVSQRVRERVLEAAAELNYRPNALPAILRTGRSGIIVVVVGGFYNPFFTEFLRCVTAVLRSRRLEALLVDTSSDDHLDELVGELSRYCIDGVISALAIRSPSVTRKLERAGTPIVAVNSKSIGTLRAISTYNRSAGALAADLLVDGGCRRLAYLASRESPSQTERQRGFLKRLRERKLPAPNEVVTGFTYEEGYAAVWRAQRNGLAAATSRGRRARGRYRTGIAGPPNSQTPVHATTVRFDSSSTLLESIR